MTASISSYTPRRLSRSAAEYNLRGDRTNVLGAQNVIDVAVDKGVKRVIALSTDKAANP